MFSESANFRMIGFYLFLLQLGCSTIRIRTNLENHVRIAIITITTGHSVGATNRTLVVSMNMDQAYLMTAEKTLLLHAANVNNPPKSDIYKCAHLCKTGQRTNVSCAATMLFFNHNYFFFASLLELHIETLFVIAFC